MNWTQFELNYIHFAKNVEVSLEKQDESVVMVKITIPKGTLLPEHIHLSDHSGYLLQGKLRIFTNDLPHDFVKGDNWHIPKNICHHTEALEDSVFFDMYHPGDENNEKTEFQDFSKN